MGFAKMEAHAFDKNVAFMLRKQQPVLRACESLIVGGSFGHKDGPKQVHFESLIQKIAAVRAH